MKKTYKFHIRAIWFKAIKITSNGSTNLLADKSFINALNWGNHCNHRVINTTIDLLSFLSSDHWGQHFISQSKTGMQNLLPTTRLRNKTESTSIYINCDKRRHHVWLMGKLFKQIRGSSVMKSTWWLKGPTLWQLL